MEKRLEEMYFDEWRRWIGEKKVEMAMWHESPFGEGGYAFRHVSGLLVIVSIAEYVDGKVWIHLSASYRNRVPLHREMVDLKDLFIGKDKYAYAVYPPAEFYVNIHPNCLHLWSRCDGPALPEFSGFVPGIGGRSI